MNVNVFFIGRAPLVSRRGRFRFYIRQFTVVAGPMLYGVVVGQEGPVLDDAFQ